MEKVAGYNLSWHHLPGSRNAMADYLSRYGASNPPVLEDLPSDPKYISSKSQRTVEMNIETRDPMVTKIADLGKRDSDYVKLIK